MHRIFFQLGPITLYFYGFFVALAVLLSVFLILRETKKNGISQEKIFDLLIAVLIGGIIGGRLLFVIINWNYYAGYPLGIFKIYEGGLAFQGALFGAGVTIITFAAVKKLSFWEISDLIAPYIALGQAVGRIGCFMNGCCFGRVITRGIGVTFPGETVVKIPAQIYSSIVLLLLFLVLIELRQRKFFTGYVFVSYLILDSILRFFLDFLRGDTPGIVLGLKLSQLISVGIFIIGIILYVIRYIMRSNQV